MRKKLAITLLAGTLALGLSGCMDQAADDVSDTISRVESGAGETVSRIESGMEDAGSRVGSAMDSMLEGSSSRGDEASPSPEPEPR